MEKMIFPQRSIKSRCWIIMSQDREVIARGTATQRHLLLTEEPSNKRVLTYSCSRTARLAIEGNFKTSKGALQHAKTKWGAAVGSTYRKSDLEAVACVFIVKYDKRKDPHE